MKDPSGTNQELTKEISALKQRIQELEQLESEPKGVLDALWKSEEKYRLLFEHLTDIIFLIDPDLRILSISPSVERSLGYKPEHLVGKTVSELNITTPASREKAASDIKRVLAGERIETALYEYRTKDGTKRFGEINTSPLFHDGRIVAAVCVSRDITARKKVEEELQDTLDSLRKAVNSTIQAMVSAVETRDPYTAGHQKRSANLALAIAAEMGLPQDKIDAIRMAGSIHDIGKLSIPAEILSKPTKLSELEFSLIKEHARRGFEMLKDVESPWPLAEIVYQHHERMDGSGYPRNLKGEEILMEARILNVADVVEAMSSHRPYRPGLGIDAALGEIEKNRGIYYDKTVADACLRLFREKGFQLERT
jgi:PAS domain S-box-containing protein/putative nucleotidyltransferase with HDIG domain